MPVVLMSGSTELPNQQSAVDVGAFDYLRKPIALGHIQAVATSAVAARQQRASDAGADERASCERLLGAVVTAASVGSK
jgi:DNA-binding NtrC family response regulator